MQVSYMLRNKPRKIGYRQRNNLSNCKEWRIPERFDGFEYDDDLVVIEEDED